MEPTRGQLVAKLEALFRLAEHENTPPHEASLALDRAQAMLRSHNLSRPATTTAASPKRSPTVFRVKMTAQYPGTCPACGRHIYPGSVIAWAPKGERNRKAVHADCATVVASA